MTIASSSVSDMNSRDYYKQGNECRKRGNFGEAINCYIKAIELDPDSPAVEAKAMLEDSTLSYEKIAKYSGLTVDEVKELASQMTA